MENEIGAIPFIGGKGTIRDSILSILSEEFPLSAKEIYSRVKHQGKNVSYQLSFYFEKDSALGQKA